MKLDMGPAEFELGGPQLGTLRDSTDLKNDPEGLRERMREDGYLLIRGLHQPAKVRVARAMLLENLRANGQLDERRPLDEGAVAEGQRGAFLGGAKAVSHRPEFLDLVEAPELMQWFASFLAGPSLTFDYKWIRAIPPGASTGAHFDVVYMGRGTRNLYTCWTPLGDVSYEMGPLAILGESPNLDKVRATYGELDVDRDHSEGHFSGDPRELLANFGGRWLTTEFSMGDALVFGMFTMHGSITNASDRLRMSCDTRYQRADESVDERWVGDNPKAHYAWHEQELVPMAELRRQWGV